MPYPPMRRLEAIQIEHEGNPVVLVQDLEGILDEQIVVGLPFFLVLSLMDGRAGGLEIQAELKQMTGGQVIRLEQIDEIAAEADRHYLLDNARAAARRSELQANFDALITRPASHAGHSYPDDPAQCRDFFDGLFEGLARGAKDSPASPRGLIIPHIDFRVGGRTIAKGLAPLPASKPPRLAIILGVAHRPTKNLFTLTDKSFETPLGLVRTDRAAADRLRALYGASRLDGAIAHRQEHSVEFAAVGLRYLYPDSEAPAILPILCGSLAEVIEADTPAPDQIPEVGEFIAALRTIIEEYAGDACVVASVDLSHVGRKFGEEEGVDDVRAAAIAAADRAMLAHVEAMDAEAFFDHFRPDGNARNVDAVTSVYVLMHALGAGTCRLIEYEQWRETETDSMVTFASLAID